MKKLLSIGLLTVCALAITERQADAWINSKFSIGLNWHLQSGNNNILWGAFKNGQVPGPEAFGGGGIGAPFQYGPQMTPPGSFPFFGNGQPNAPQGIPVQTAPPPQSAQEYQYQYNPYQSVSYQPNTGYVYPSYTYPNYYSNYSQQQVPYYWYQGR